MFLGTVHEPGVAQDHGDSTSGGGRQMGFNTVFFGWNRSIPGRERLSGAHFEDFVGYLTGLQKSP